MISSSIDSGDNFVDFSRKQPPPVSDHIFVHQGWSRTREFTVASSQIVSCYRNRCFFTGWSGENAN